MKTMRHKIPAGGLHQRSYGDMATALSMSISLAHSGCSFLVQSKGEQVSDWQRNWQMACALAGIETMLFHYLRRTALTNLMEARFSEKEAMEISGRQTTDVFGRYHIVSEQRLKTPSGESGGSLGH
jgi:integrase